MPAATAAALPPEEPPGVRVTSHGLRVHSVTGAMPYSGMAVVPTTTAPAARRRWTTLWSCPGRTSRIRAAPHVRRSPATARLDFTATGTPGERPCVAGADRGGRGARAVVIDVDERAEVRVARVDPREREVDQLERGQLPRADGRGQLAGGACEGVVIGHARQPTCQ